MTIATEDTRKQYDGNDVTTEFAFPYTFNEDADLVVVLTDGNVDPEVNHTQVLDSDYSVTGEGAGTSGLVTMVTPPATGERLTIYRSIDFTQETDLSNQDAYYLETLEDALDLIAMMVQQLQEESDRSVKLPVTVEDPYSVDDYREDCETAQVAAEAAQSGAETAETNAETAQTAAELAETNAAASAAAAMPQYNLLKNTGFQAFSRSAALYNYGSQVTLTDVTAGVCSTTDTEDIQVGSLFTFDAGDFNGETYSVTVVTADTSFTINDTSKTDSGVPGTGYEVVPGNEGADPYAPDGWAKQTAPNVYRVIGSSIVHAGELYGLQIDGNGGSDVYFPANIYANPEWIAKFKGRTITFGLWVITDGADQVTISISDGVGSATSSGNAGTGLEFLTVTRTVSDSATLLYMYPNIDVGKTAYISCPILVYGSVCPSYIPPVDKWVPFDASVASATYASGAFSTQAATGLNIQSDSEGKIGLGVEYVDVRMHVRDSGSAGTTSHMWIGPNGGGNTMGIYASCFGLANDSWARGNGFAMLGADGLAEVELQASGGSTLDAALFYRGIKVK